MALPLLLVLWLVAKPLLHGQMGWLWWTPMFLIFLGIIVQAIKGPAAKTVLVVGLLVGVVGGPVAAKLQQQGAAEQAFFNATTPLLDHDRISGGFGEDRGTVVDAGWEVCDGLDAVRDAGREAFGGRGPYEVTASFAAFGNGMGFSEGEDDLERDWIEFIRLADQHLC